jgi:hypothetical protein
VLSKFDDTQRDTRTKQLMWGAKQFAGLTVAEVTADRIAKARDACAAETFTKGKPHKDKKTGEIVPPKEFKRTPATVNRYIAALSHAMSFAVKERRLIDRNPVGDIRREKEPRGRTRFDAVNLILLAKVLVQFRSSSYAQTKDIVPALDRIEIASEQAPGEFIVSEF